MWSAFGLAILAHALPEASLLLEQSWTVNSDSRHQSICALLQTRQGYLWIGTDKGLIRFDGVRFTDFPFATTPGMSQGTTVFNAMWEDRSGGIWAGTDAGATHYDGRQFSSITTREGLPSDSILRIDGDETGAVWIFTRKGVSLWKHGTLRTVHPEQEGQYPGPLIAEFRNDSEDLAHLGLWRRRGVLGLERFAHGHWNPFPLPFRDKRHESSQIRSVFEDSLGRVWYSLWSELTNYYQVTPDNTLRKYQGLPAQSFVFFQDHDGFLWLTDHQSHTARWKNGVLYSVPTLRTPILTHMIERPDGGLWAGTYQTRLFLFRQRLITAIRTPAAGELGPLLFRARDGTVWAASTHLLHFHGAQAAPIAVLGGSNIFGVATALGEDGRGNLLLGERWRPGVYEFKGRKIIRYPRFTAVTGSVQSILTGSGGDEWFGTSTGLFHEHSGEILRVPGLPGTQVTCLLESAPSQLWVGTDKGAGMVAGGMVAAFPPSSKWAPWNVSSIAKDPDGSIWISSLDQGLVHYVGGEFHAYDQRDGLPTNTIFAVDASDPNNLWLRTDSGLLRLDRRDLLRVPTDGTPSIRVITFDEADGLPLAEMSPPGNQGVLHFPDGTTWFSSLGGIASMRPDALDRISTRPHAVIEEHLIDASGLLPSTPDGIVLLPNQTNLEIRYTALGSSHPERVNFRYQLVSIDNGWVSSGSRRAAFYTHLPPGQYVFRVQAEDGDESGWKEPEAQILVTVRTPFYKTWWMKTLLLLFLASLAAFAMEVRRRQQLEIQRARRLFTHRLIASQETERKRIAHELHDGLGQHLALIRTLALLPARLRAARSAEQDSSDVGVDSLSTIADQAATAIHEVEAICYALRPYQLDRLGLTKAVRSLLRTLEEGNSLVLRSSVEDIDDFFAREQEITFYRILQEGISNILKHSGATEAEVVVACDGARLRLTIQDNGRGFSVASQEVSGESLGLIGITERAEALGGTATIESSGQAGTRIVVEAVRSRPGAKTRQ